MVQVGSKGVVAKGEVDDPSFSCAGERLSARAGANRRPHLAREQGPSEACAFAPGSTRAHLRSPPSIESWL